MSYAGSYTAVVDAPIDAVWTALLDKVYDPTKYVAGVHKVEIVQDGKLDGTGVERKMWRGAAPAPIHELITTTEFSPERRTIKFAMVSHPILQGDVLNTVESVENGAKSALTFSLQWNRRPDAPADAPAPFADANEAAKGAVMQTKEHVEAAVKQA